MKIIVDMMGGDRAPEETVKGICQAAQEFNASLSEDDRRLKAA